MNKSELIRELYGLLLEHVPDYLQITPHSFNRVSTKSLEDLHSLLSDPPNIDRLPTETPLELSRSRWIRSLTPNARDWFKYISKHYGLKIPEYIGFPLPVFPAIVNYLRDYHERRLR